MPAIFTIDQATLPPGVPDQSRQDIIPGGAAVQFTAQFPPPNHTTYKWEFLSQPPGVTVAFSDPAIHNPTANFGMNYGGYLVRLTVDEGLATEDVSVRAVYLKWPISGKAFPALSETNQDNSQPPNTGIRGWEEKIHEYLWWVEQNIGGSSSVLTPKNYVYVDEHNGDDVLGTGEFNNPYKTLQHAANQVPDPTSTLDFYLPWHFVLNPGVYPGKVGLPGKRALYVIEAPGGAAIQGDIDWDVDPDWWAAFGAPSANYAALVMYAPGVADYPGEGGAFLWHRGILQVQNSNPGGGNPMVANKFLHAKGTYWSDGGIWNRASGTATPAAATGPLTCFFDHSAVIRSGPSEGIFGEREAITGVDFLPNLISIYADNCDLGSLYGSIHLCSIQDSSFGNIDNTVDWAGNPLSGYVSGEGPGFQKSTLRTLKAGHDGTDAAAPLAPAVWFDSYTWNALAGGGTFTNMSGDSPSNRGYNFSEMDTGIDVDASGFVNNLGPPNALPILSDVLARIDSMSLGAGPTGLGRIHVDPVNGSDVSGNGTRNNPYQTLQHACSTITTTVNPAEFTTPYEFIMSPGVDASAGPIIPPPRQKVTITGRDTLIQQPIQWLLDPSWWPACGLVPTDYFPELHIDGRVIGTRARSYELVPPSGLNIPSLLLVGGISAQNTNPGGAGGAWSGGHRLILDGVSTTGVSNLPSGGAGPATSDATGRMFLDLDRTFIGGFNPPLRGFVASEKEPLIPGEYNEIYISAKKSYIYSILANAYLSGFQDCRIETISRTYDATLAPILDGYIGCANPQSDGRPIFRDCRLGDNPLGYAFGWDGVTGSEPYGPSFDAVSYRSILESEKNGPVPFTVDNVTSYPEVMVDEAPSRIQVAANSGAPAPAYNLIAGGHVSVGTAWMVPWVSGLPALVSDGDFQHPAGGGPPSQILIRRSGRYKVTFSVNVWNAQVLFNNTIGMGGWRNLAPVVASTSYIDVASGSAGSPTPATGVLIGFDGYLNAGDILELGVWVASAATGPAPIFVEDTATLGWVERVE